MVAGLAVTSAAQAVKYNYEYKCPETVVVRYCRNDEGQKVNELDNHCMVEYPDRPRNVATIPFFRSVVKNDLAVELKNCKGPAAADPAIAKASAAKVDTGVFGIQLGDPFTLPACPMFQLGGAGRQTCYSAMVDQVGAIARQGGGPDVMPANLKTVYLAADNCPSWVNECTLVVQSFEGKVGYIGVFTKGPGVDTVVREALAEKYGKWSLANDVTVTPGDANKRVFKTTQYWWNLPGLYIHYQPVWEAADGSVPDIREGLIRIETETARKAKAADAAKRPKPKM
jgi:hypothetical protein